MRTFASRPMLPRILIKGKAWHPHTASSTTQHRIGTIVGLSFARFFRPAKIGSEINSSSARTFPGMTASILLLLKGLLIEKSSSSFWHQINDIHNLEAAAASFSTTQPLKFPPCLKLTSLAHSLSKHRLTYSWGDLWYSMTDALITILNVMHIPQSHYWFHTPLSHFSHFQIRLTALRSTTQ